MVKTTFPSRSGLLAATSACCLLGLVALYSTTKADQPVGRPPPAEGPAQASEPIRPVPDPPAQDPGLVALGKQLFQDQRLSANNTMSCLSCHDTATNGATSQRFDPMPEGGFAIRNTPTVFNAALNFRLDWTGDARTLQDQAEESMHEGMQQDVAAAVSKLTTDTNTVAAFQKAVGHGPDRKSILNAIAAYEKTLLTPMSSFDRWLQGEPDAISPEAQQGYALFKSLGCVSCHQGVNVGGNLFQQSGVYNVLSDPTRPILRVPSLRNVATTAPYFHDGSTATLPAAVGKMAGAQLDRQVTAEEVRQIVAFLQSLTGQYAGHQVTAGDSVH